MAKRTKISTMANVRDGEYGLTLKYVETVPVTL